MKYLISAYCWTIGMVYLVLILLFTLIVSYIFDEKTYDPWLKALLRSFFKVLRIPVETEGLENVKSGKSYLFMANHVSLFDVPLLGAYVPGIARGVEARRQHKWPLYGLVVKRLGNIPIDRGSIHNSIRTIRKTADIMNTGKSMIILPEGTRTLDGNLSPFKKLPFYLAKQIDHEIVPIGLSGLYGLKAKNSRLIRPMPVKIKFGKPVSTEIIRQLGEEELKDLVFREIYNLIERP